MTDVLMVSLLVPNDNGSGIQRRAAAHLKALADRFRVHLLAFEAQPGARSPEQQALLDRCASAVVIPAPERPRRTPVNLPPLAIISEILDPTTARWVPRDEVLHDAVAHLPTRSFDAAFCFRIRSGLIFRRLQQVSPLDVGRRIVDFDDIESLVYVRSEAYATRSRGFEQAVIDRLKLRRLRRIERDFLDAFDDVLVCSDQDRRLLSSMGGRAKVHAIPNSVPIPEATMPPRCGERANILFVGTMTYAPNQDAASWFCRAILPRIRASLDQPLDVKLVGFNPPASIRKLAEIPDVEVTGGVDRVEPYYAACDLVVAPIRYGGGTRIKILEAMSHARPVVSTTIGAEGLDVRSGENIMLADTEDAFAEACIALLRDPARREACALAGRRFVEQRYGAPVIAETLAAVIGV